METVMETALYVHDLLSRPLSLRGIGMSVALVASLVIAIF
jgi:hypothetical protein